jgi:hypothetical protein
MPNTFRSDIIAGVGTMMNAFIAANPTLLRQHFRMRPSTFVKDTPFSYVDGRPEVIHYDAALRERVMTLELVVLDRWTESGEVMDRMDDLTDSLIVHFSSYYRMIPGSWWSDLALADEQEEGLVGTRFRWEIHYADGSQ